MRCYLSAWTAGLLATCSYLPYAAAFYPYTPEYGDHDDTTEQHRRSTAVPGPGFEEDGSLTLPLRRVPVRRANTYKIVQSSDPKQEKSVAIDQDGTDLSYMVAVTFGEGEEEYNLLLDSAATNTWVMAAECKSAACGTHNTFGSSDSSSLKTQSTTFSVTYGTGSVSGTDASDTLHLGSLSADVTFGLATNVSDDFKSYPMDGILGIGRAEKQDAVDATQFMSVLKASNAIPAKLFGVHLSRAKDGSNDGELNLGAPNKDRYDGNLNYIKTSGSNAGFWEISADDAGADGTSLNLKGRSAILDTGTSYILMPPADAAAVHSLIPGSKNSSAETFTIPCDSKQTIWFAFNGQRYNVSTDDYIAGLADNGLCKSNIVGRQTFGENEWLVGDVFLKNVYAVFDYDNEQVGLGVKKVQAEATSSSSVKPTGLATATGSSSTLASGAAATTTGSAASSQRAGATGSPGQSGAAERRRRGWIWESIAVVGVAGVLGL